MPLNKEIKSKQTNKQTHSHTHTHIHTHTHTHIYIYIYSYLFLLATRQNLTQCFFHSGCLCEGNVRHEPRLVPFWTILVIGSPGAMWTMQNFLKSSYTKPGDLAGHSLTRTESLVLCLSSPTYRMSDQSQEPFCLQSIVDLITHPAGMLGGPI